MRYRLLVLLLVLTALPVAAQPVIEIDTTQAGPYDQGKMWLFEEPPVEYLAETYDFHPSEAWFKRARMASLRIPGCSASFVSGDGLMATNHHCARSAIVSVQQEGEDLLEDGFLATTMADERIAPDMYADQLIRIFDVTAEVNEAGEDAQVRAAAMEELETQLAQEAAAWGTGLDEDYHVEVTELYNGGRYSAYVFRRYDDVRLVMAPELQLGFFGGDEDNFTFPRYALDFAFLRAYDDEGQPLDTADHFFPWTDEGVSEGDLLFVIGNPGSTNRLEAVSQTLYRRDVQVPAVLNFLDTRIAAMEAYLAEHPEDSAYRNQMFGLLNAQKAYRGRREGLADPAIVGRLRAGERVFRAEVGADTALAEQYGSLFDEIASVQREKRALGPSYNAFGFLLTPRYSSATLRRAMLAAQLQSARRDGDEASAQQLEAALPEVGDQPRELERRFLTAQLRNLQDFYDVRKLVAPPPLRGNSPQAAAEILLKESALTEDAVVSTIAEGGEVPVDDPAVVLATQLLPRLTSFEQQRQQLGAREAELNRQLGRARFAVYGAAVPPDATFSPRFSDGVVAGYPYNGTMAPPMTTFFGLYDHFYAYGPDSEWALPERWVPVPEGLDLSTPLNFASTADTIGGNSGSPAVNRDLELVGLNFDRAIEGLVRDYIYLPERGRNVMVDARAVIESLRDVYGLDRLVQELEAGALPGAE